jgi:hypothetical protein
MVEQHIAPGLQQVAPALQQSALAMSLLPQQPAPSLQQEAPSLQQVAALSPLQQAEPDLQQAAPSLQQEDACVLEDPSEDSVGAAFCAHRLIANNSVTRRVLIFIASSISWLGLAHETVMECLSERSG